MINERSVEVVGKSEYGQNFRKPIYDSYGFSNIPSNIPALLGEEHSTLPEGVLEKERKNYDKVVVFFFDAFGWRFYEQFSSHPTIAGLTNEGKVSKFTSQFPSTTAAHVTTINTGQAVGEHGLYEWNYYEPRADQVVASLPFSILRGDPGSLSAIGIRPQDIYPNSTLYHRLSDRGISSHVFQLENIAYSPYSNVVTNGANIHPYRSLEDGFQKLIKELSIDGKGYYFLYFGNFDSVCHEHGPDSVEAELEAVSVLNKLGVFLDNVKRPDDTLFLITADHGQVQTPENKCHYINVEVPEIIPMLKTSKNGDIIIPAGSPRDFFLHVKAERLHEAQSVLQTHLGELARVEIVQELIGNRFFGAKISPTFRSRVGNLVILPYGNNTVWWYEKDKIFLEDAGHHGGLSKEEMEIPVITLSL